MSLPFPKPFFNSLVRKGRHGKARMRDAKPSFFVGKHGCSCVDGVALQLRAGERPRCKRRASTTGRLTAKPN